MMTIKQLNEMTEEQRMKFCGVPKCHVCKEYIKEHPDEYIYLSDDIVCPDCYYEALGDFIEQNPIGGHRR